MTGNVIRRMLFSNPIGFLSGFGVFYMITVVLAIIGFIKVLSMLGANQERRIGISLNPRSHSGAAFARFVLLVVYERLRFISVSVFVFDLMLVMFLGSL